ncbi:MAG: hypothetical protein UHK60_00835, partial [Acutalibacteraceae bacterium]|nr:hypothetical protein [Acutalibacteraceae bacterium]
MAVERAERNSDGSYDAFDSGGFGKDYHGQDVFGGRIGRTGIGGIHFGGKAAGDFSGADELGEGHFTERYTNYGQVTQTEAPDTSAFEGEANEVADSMRESIQGVNEETAENSNTGSTMDTSFQIGGIEEDKEKLKQELESSGLDFNDPTWGEAYQRELERAEERLNKTNEWADKMMSENEKKHSSVNNSIDYLDNLSDKTSNIAYNAAYSIMDNLESLAASYGVDDFDRNKIEEAYKERGTEVLRNANDEIFERKNAEIDKVVKGAQGKRDKFKNIVDSYKSSTTDKTKTSFTDKMKPSTEAKPDIVKQVDKEKLKQELERLERAEEELGETNEWADKMKSALNKSKNAFNTSIDSLDNKSISVRLANKLYNTADTVLDGFETLAKDYGIDDFDRNKIKEAYKEKGTDALRDGLDKICEEIEAYIDKEVKG